MPPIESRTPPAASESPIARAWGTERASRSSLGVLGTTSVSHRGDRGQRLLQTGATTVAARHAVIEIDAVIADPELVECEALGGEVLLVG